MGGSLSKFMSGYCHPHAIATNIRAFVSRKRRSDEDNDRDMMLEKTIHTPKKFKLPSTAQYIYRTLFKEGNNSDVTVIALGKPWKLHKVNLFQSPYFTSMFFGARRESKQDFVEIEVVDPKINLDSLHTVLGSLYLDEITVKPNEVVPILATATLFELEGIIDQCTDIMIETMNAETAVKYYDAAHECGVKKVKEVAFKWLLINLLSYFPQQSEHLREISVDLME
jgi:BTB/POZ domain-containing protein 13